MTAFFFLAVDGIRDAQESRGLGDVSKSQVEYRVQALRVVDSDQESLSVDTSTDKKLLLVTCYPFDAILAGGPLRYVVTAVPTLVGLPPRSDVAWSGKAADGQLLKIEAL